MKLGTDRFVVSGAVPSGMFAGMAYETDEAAPYGYPSTRDGMIWEIDMPPPPSWLKYENRRYPHRLYVNFETHRDALLKARNILLLDRLVPQRITILDGKVQMHPDWDEHWRCPFCHPEMAALYHGREAQDDHT